MISMFARRNDSNKGLMGSQQNTPELTQRDEEDEDEDTPNFDDDLMGAAWSTLLRLLLRWL